MLRVGIDSNILTYFINTSSPNYDPAEDKSHHAKEHIAIIQGYLYGGDPYILVPTVSNECARIPDSKNKELHKTYALALFRDGSSNLNRRVVEKRRDQLHLTTRHPKNDCQILAEAEASDLDYLLTCDPTFLSRLSSEAKGLLLIKPTEYLKKLNIMPGQKPKIQPHYSNPLSNKTWWKI